MVVARAREFATEHVARHAERWERERHYPREAIRLASPDLGGMIVPRELGGKGASLTTFLRMIEELAKVDIAFALAFVVHGNVAFVISQSSNARLRDRLLPGLISGATIGAFCLTEPQAGSDAASITTLARTTADGYRLTGTKAWVTNAAAADVLAVFARTAADGGAKSIALFGIDANRDGIRRGAPYDLISGNLVQVGDIAFEQCVAAKDEVLFEPGNGFAAAMRALDAARLGVAAMCNGALASALAHSMDYARGRRMFGTTTMDKQGIQWAYADQVTELEASRALTFHAASLFQAGKGSPSVSAHAKKFANKTAAGGMSWAMRAMGAAGTDRRHPLARQFGSAQLLFNTDGTPEVMNVVIGRELARGGA